MMRHSPFSPICLMTDDYLSRGVGRGAIGFILKARCVSANRVRGGRREARLPFLRAALAGSNG
jgi:hypothetical protein